MIPVANSYYSGGGLFDIGLQKGGVEIGIQLVMHQTVFKSDNSQCEIVIEDKQ